MNQAEARQIVYGNDPTNAAQLEQANLIVTQVAVVRELDQKAGVYELPTYSDLVQALRKLTAWTPLIDAPNSCAPLDREGRHLTAEAAAILARIPA